MFGLIEVKWMITVLIRYLLLVLAHVLSIGLLKRISVVMYLNILYLLNISRYKCMYAYNISIHNCVRHPPSFTLHSSYYGSYSCSGSKLLVFIDSPVGRCIQAFRKLFSSFGLILVLTKISDLMFNRTDSNFCVHCSELQVCVRPLEERELDQLKHCVVLIVACRMFEEV